jgi:hypothetical protein
MFTPDPWLTYLTCTEVIILNYNQLEVTKLRLMNNKRINLAIIDKV